VARDDGDLGDVGRRIGAARAFRRRNLHRAPFRDDSAGDDANDWHLRIAARDREIPGFDFRRLHAFQTDRRYVRSGREDCIIDDPPRGDDRLHGAGLEVLQKHDIGAAAGRDKPAVAKAEGVRPRPARGPIDVMEGPAERDQRADHVIEVTLLGDIERIAVVGAQAHEARRVLIEHLGERVHVLRDRALADEDRHAFLQLLARFVGRGRFVVGADPCREIGVEIAAAKERRVPVDMAILIGHKLVEHIGRRGQHAGKVHELGKADDLPMAAEGQKISRKQSRARGFELGRRNAGGELDAEVHHGRLCRSEKVANAFGAKHVGDLMRIADRGRHATRENAAIELGRRHQRGFDVKMRVDEARHGE
jgi:hypothetical protein